VTIAIDLGGERAASGDGAPASEMAEARPIEEWAERFRRGAANLFDRDLVRSLLSRMGGASSTRHDDQDVPAAVEEHETWPAGLGRFDMMNQSLEAMQRMLTRYRLAGDQPDVLITVPKDACRTLDFHRASNMIALGGELTVAALDREITTTSPS
jgi:NTE family protein